MPQSCNLKLPFLFLHFFQKFQTEIINFFISRRTEKSSIPNRSLSRKYSKKYQNMLKLKTNCKGSRGVKNSCGIVLAIVVSDLNFSVDVPGEI